MGEILTFGFWAVLVPLVVIMTFIYFYSYEVKEAGQMPKVEFELIEKSTNCKPAMITDLHVEPEAAPVVATPRIVEIGQSKPPPFGTLK